MSFEKNPRDAVVVVALRTAVGKGNRGTLKDTRPDDLAGAVFKAAVEAAAPLKPEDIDDVILGCATPEAEQGMNVGRVAVEIAGLPESVPGFTINRFCSSGLQSLANGAEKIMAGWGDVVLSGGVESMSMLPMGGHNMRPNPTLMERHPEAYTSMGLTAETVAERFNVNRAVQDAFALESHKKALAAIEAGNFVEEIVPVMATTYVDGKEVPVEFKVDEGPRAGSRMEGLAKLRSPFKEGGSVTAATSSQVSDGAAATLVMSREKAEKLGLEVLAVLRMYSVVGVPADIMGVGPLYAIPAALKRAGMKLEDIDVFEINEAFAAQAIYCVRELGIAPEKVNPNGGAIALGHPLGCTGAKLTATLLHHMKRNDLHYGMVSMCIGGGMGAAAIFERES